MTANPPLPSLTIKGMRIPLPIVQGGMGVGVSLAPLAGAVARAGGLGLLSSACLDRLVGARLGRRVGTREAVAHEVAAAKAGGGYAGINIMVAVQRDYEASVRSAVAAGADAIVSGAGLPLALPLLPQLRAGRDTHLRAHPLGRSLELSAGPAGAGRCGGL